MKIFTSKEFIDKLRHIAYLPTTYYSGGNQWSTWNGYRWNFDCVVSVKSVLWGWNENKNVLHGGAIYGSNGVKDFTCNEGLDFCTDVSTNFSNLTPGEYLCMKGTQFDHVGVYLGNGKVFEVTTAWGVNGATISEIDNYGTRSRNGVRSLRWTYHGKLKWIDYTNEPTPTPSDKEVNVYYQVETKEDGVLPMVKNLDDYAGYKDHAIRYLAMKVDKGSIKYRVTTISGKTLDWITQCNINDHNLGCAGNGEPICTVEAYYYTPEDIVRESGYKYIYYKVNNYPYQKDTIKAPGFDGYAGVYGVIATKFQAYIDN